MTHPRQSDRAFGLTMAAVFAVITAVGWLVFGQAPAWALVVAAVFLVPALLVPWLLLPLNRLWGAVAERLGRVLNFVLLAAFFYLIVLPAGLVMRLLGQDPMARRFDAKAKTYFAPVRRKTDSETLKDMF